jgi:hypothetical protein
MNNFNCDYYWKKIGKLYSLEYTDIPDVLFTPHLVGCCCTNVIQGQCCATVVVNNGTSGPTFARKATDRLDEPIR